MVDLDYLNKYYGEENEDFLKLRGDSRFTWSVSHGVYMRAYNSPVTHSYTAARTEEIVDVVRPSVLPRGVPAEQAFEEWVNVGNSSLPVQERRAQRRWWFGGFALVLDKVEPLPFVRWKGALGLFEVPDDYTTRASHAEVSHG